jgi:hypothetical protein
MAKGEAQRRFLNRRQFLALTAAGAAVPWLGDLAHAAPAVRVEPLSVGYLDETDQLALHYDRLPWSIPKRMSAAEPKTITVLPAAGLDLGDQRLAGGDVKLTVHGLYPANPADCRGVEALDLDVLFPPPDPALPVPARFMAWSFRRHPLNTSPPVSFRVPLGLDGRLDLTLRSVVEGAAVGARLIETKLQTSFTVDWQADRPKLRRGVYVLGVRPRIWDAEVKLPGAGQRGKAAELCSVVVSVEPIAAE